MNPEHPTTTELKYKLSLRVLMLIAAGGFLMGGTFCVLGVLLVYRDATAPAGDTQINLFGATLSSGSVGISSIFIAAVTVILVIRQVLQSFDAVLRTMIPPPPRT
jgi:hypothetical protein